MALGAQLPVRLEDDVEKRLEDVAQKSGTTKSALIRLLAKTFVEHVVGKDGTVTLPPNWKTLLAPADGRSALALQESADAKAQGPAKPTSYLKSKKTSAAAKLAKKAAGEN